MKLSSGLFLKNRLMQPNQQTKREIHRTLTIQRKTEVKSRHKVIVSQSRGKKKRRANNKSDKQ